MQTVAATRIKAITGSLIGTAIGDAMGLPAEGLSRNRQKALFGTLTEHRFLFGRGMVSDDTEHTILVANALLHSVGEPKRFEKALARGLCGWLALIPAGAGLATVRATLKLLVGIPPARSGVWSAGNGPAMRSALLGVCYGDDFDRLLPLIRANTRLTHTDPKAEYGALAVAVAASLSADNRLTAERLLSTLQSLLPENDEANALLSLLEKAGYSAGAGETTLHFAESVGLPQRVSGYVYHTVPVAVHACLRSPGDFRAAVEGVIACGGDTDTVAAIVGGIIGANVGEAGIPQSWRDHLAEWPRDVACLRRLASQLAEGSETERPQKPPSVFVPFIALRNILFLSVVLYHGFRRLAPPYGMKK